MRLFFNWLEINNLEEEKFWSNTDGKVPHTKTYILREAMGNFLVKLQLAVVLTVKTFALRFFSLSEFLSYVAGKSNLEVS